ncbi:hypothetical protein BX265_5026 [Streptomyces sp. TLI_235]|nr:hypothetical protein [Streptomyces sp. TLI_235]PBC80188.1 hypothetical protein BX265_5026 [Streptomyces sp. TLI_235]
MTLSQIGGPVPYTIRREPALWLAFIASLVKMGGAFWLSLTPERQALVNALAAAAVGLIVALVAHDALGAPIVGTIQAGLALAVGLGLHWSADRQAIVMTAVGAGVAMWTRTQVTASAGARPALPLAPVRRQ